MSWFSGSTVPVADLELKINEATSESIPNGELDLAIALEITDLIRSKKIPPKQCMRSLKKRLTTTHSNPNLLTLTLKLVDLCVKNGGYHFLVELSSKEFIDYLVDYIFKIHYNTKDSYVIENEAKYKVGSFILSLIKDWTLVFENQTLLNYVERSYHQLMNQGYEFPELEVGGQLSNKFIDSEAPPDWIDSNECMICYNPFSLMNRKHHCRSCGGVYCQTHSSHNSPLVALGIMEPVRVCDNCYEKIKSKNSKHLSKVRHKKTPSQPTDEDLDDEDEQLRKAIELSLRETQVPVSNQIPPPRSPSPVVANNAAEEEDEEMKAAIAASLKEFEQQEKMYKQQPAASQQGYQEPQSEFYRHILPFDQQDASYQNQNPSQQPQMAPANHAEQYHLKPQVEDLSQQEEESINLFITLMNNIKSDPSKQANILYDSNLSELHGKIIQLKPKLNKSLRASIEKYETCLELNNKISTISRLYDQFLESKLNQAYGNHTISSPYGGPNQSFQGPYPSQTSNEYIPYPVDHRALSPQYQQNPLQFRNYSSPGLSQQPTGYNNYPQIGQASEPSNQPPASESAQNTVQHPQEPPPTSFYPSYYQESDLETPQTNQDNGMSPYYSSKKESESNINVSAYPYESTYPPQDSNGSFNQNTPSQPNYNPSLPTEPSYPPFEHDDDAEDHAAAKFPSINELNSEEQTTNTGGQDDNKVPSMPSMPQFGQPSQETDRKGKLVEEPLIEL